MFLGLLRANDSAWSGRVNSILEELHYWIKTCLTKDDLGRWGVADLVSCHSFVA